MSVFLEHLSMWNMLNCAEQVQIQKYKTHAYKTLKTVGVQIIMLIHPTKHRIKGKQTPSDCQYNKNKQGKTKHLVTVSTMEKNKQNVHHATTTAVKPNKTNTQYVPVQTEHMLHKRQHNQTKQNKTKHSVSNHHCSQTKQNKTPNKNHFKQNKY